MPTIQYEIMSTRNHPLFNQTYDIHLVVSGSEGTGHFFICECPNEEIAEFVMGALIKRLPNLPENLRLSIQE
jgi:hypothetical protein